MASALRGEVNAAICVGIHDRLSEAHRAEGWKIEPEDLAEISPYLTEHIMRFGEYSTHELSDAPEAYEVHLDVDFTQFGPDAGPEAEVA